MFSTLDEYNEKLLYLTNSLNIKLIDVAAAMNNGVVAAGYSIPDNKEEWKYFLNISGQRHITNSDVKITIIETSEVVSLTKEILVKYPYTKSELLKQDKYYINLTEAYPNDTLFIKGCMYPCDISAAVAADEGTILSYDTNLVEVSEYTLISDLEGYVQRFLKRWNVKAYTIVDGLYLSGLIAVLYANIPPQITAIRVSKINTAEVHSFFLEHFFRSNLNLWDDVQVLKPQTIYWLYRNLKYLRKNLGKQKTLDLILTKVFDTNSYGVGTYNIKIPDQLVNTNFINDPTVPYFKRQDPIVVSEGLNKSFTTDNSETLTLPEFITLEETRSVNMDIVPTTDIITFDTSILQNNLKYQRHNTVKTKAITVSTIKLFDSKNVDILELILYYWAHAVKNDSYNTVVDYTEPNTVSISADTLIDYTDPNSNQFFTLTPRQGLLFLIKQLLFITGNTSLPLSTLNYAVLSTDTDRFDTVVKNSYHDGYTETFVPFIKDALPKDMGDMNSVLEFNTYLTKVMDYHGLVWTLDSNSENALVSMNIKNIMGKMLLSDTFDLTTAGKSLTIDELILKENKTYTMTNNFNVYNSMTVLIKAFTGIDIDPYLNIRDRLTCLTNILNKLTSYTVQCIKPDAVKDEIPVYYNNIQNVRAINGLVACLDADLTPLELNYVHIKAIANDFRDRLTFFSYITNPLAGMCSKPISGYAVIDDTVNEFEIETSTPATRISVMDKVICDAKYVNYKDQFLIGITSEVYPNEKFIGNVVASSEVPIDAVASFSTTSPDTRVIVSKDQLEGLAVVIEDDDFEIYQPSPIRDIVVSDIETIYTVEKP